jgi:aspartyl-tRNA synthetase
MNRTLLNNLKDVTEGGVVRLLGWVQTIRNQKRMQFFELRDHTGVVQIVHERNDDGEISAIIDSLSLETVVEVIGAVVLNPRLKHGDREISLSNLVVLNPAQSPLPLQDNAGVETKLDWRYLELRKPENFLTFQVQTTVLSSIREFWLNEGFIEIFSPKLMSGASEGGAELFQLDYFGKPACLAQSPQFYKEMGVAAGFDKVFEIGPAFRAEQSRTTRHATEFTSVDAEIAWINTHEDVMNLEERMLHRVLETVISKHGDALKAQLGVEVIAPSLPFPRMTLAEAHERLAQIGYVVPSEKGGDLDPEGERRIARFVQETLGHEFIFITDYPASLRPFYHMRPAHAPHLTNSFDLLWKGVEITTGSQREHRYDRLVAQAREKGVDLDSIGDYLNCFRYGMPPHGGYGLGLARLLKQLLNASSVRDVSFLFRGPNRLSP